MKVNAGKRMQTGLRRTSLLLSAIAAAVLDDLLRPHGWTASDPDQAITAGCGYALWAALLWLSLSTALATIADCSTVRRRCPRLALHIAPRTIQRFVRTATTAGFVTAVTGMGLSAAVADPAHDTAAVSSSPLDWPGVTDAPTSTPPARTPTPAPTVARPTTQLRPRGTPHDPRQLTVRSGDSLWSIAARELPPGSSATTIATTWPRWYAANRAVIGPNPDVIQPGQQLRGPGSD